MNPIYQFYLNKPEFEAVKDYLLNFAADEVLKQLANGETSFATSYKDIVSVINKSFSNLEEEYAKKPTASTESSL